jgi:hypothetical protein
MLLFYNFMTNCLKNYVILFCYFTLSCLRSQSVIKLFELCNIFILLLHVQDERAFRIQRALQCAVMHTVLPKEDWVSYEEDQVKIFI